MDETLFTMAPPGPADLRYYDKIILNSSGGKDSQVMLDVVAGLARAAGVSDRVVVAHADLGRLEWPGTLELARAQAEHYGLRFEVVRNRKWRDLLHRIESRGRWPDAQNRYCTSEFKTGQVLRLMTGLVREVRDVFILGRRVRILNCLGMRAQESPARAKKPPFGPDAKATNKTLRKVDRWLPIHHWTEDQVWDRIRSSGVPHHPAYDAGMPRLSCSFCVLASRSALVLAAQLRPKLAAEYAAVEERIDHRFTDAFSMADIIAEASARPPITTVENWSA